MILKVFDCSQKRYVQTLTKTVEAAAKAKNIGTSAAEKKVTFCTGSCFLRVLVSVSPLCWSLDGKDGGGKNIVWGFALIQLGLDIGHTLGTWGWEIRHTFGLF